jgi:Ca-activated chloride channel family protein
MKMTIGQRTIVAKINKREEARKEYEQAKKAGKSASLLEQQRPNVFQMNVANIMPGDLIKVELNYTELITPEDGVYEFVYPTVVGPRYRTSLRPPQTQRRNGSNIPTTSCNARCTPSIFRESEHRPPVSDVKANRTGSTWLMTACTAFVNSTAVKPPEWTRFHTKIQACGDSINSAICIQRLKGNFFLLMMQPPKSSN